MNASVLVLLLRVMFGEPGLGAPEDPGDQYQGARRGLRDGEQRANAAFRLDERMRATRIAIGWGHRRIGSRAPVNGGRAP